MGRKFQIRYSGNGLSHPYMTGRVYGWDWTHMKASSLPRLVVDVGHHLGPQLCCWPEHICVASPSGLDFLTVWQPQQSCTSYMKSQGSKSECPREQGRSCITSSDWASEVSESPFYHILLVTGKSQNRLDSRGGEKISSLMAGLSKDL